MTERTSKGRRHAGDGDHPKELAEMTVKNALVAYPQLREIEELRRQFERITGKNSHNFESHISSLLEHFAEGEIAKGITSCTNDHCTESLKILQKNERDSARKNAARMLLFGCAQSEKKWWNLVVKLIEKDGDIRIGRLQPTVLVHETPFRRNCADVYCEKNKVVGGANFYEAILACYYLYYIFNIDLPPEDLELFKPFENVLNLKSHDGQK